VDLPRDKGVDTPGKEKIVDAPGTILPIMLKLVTFD
jgi:hypothetical protein